MSRRPPPSLSVVIATVQGWPAMRACLEALSDQVDAAGGEMIVADGSGAAPPAREWLRPRMTWLQRPGSSGVFELRELALRRARGQIIAVTEDHCVVAPDWCARILEAHARHPAAAAVKGVVANGTRERLTDWAAFLVNQAPHLGPFVGAETDAVVGVSCVSYKRWAMECRSAGREPWLPELRDPRAWLDAGHQLLADPRIRAEHYQSVGFLAMSALQFHNGRAISGLRRPRMRRRDWIRVVAAPVLPFVRALRTVWLCSGKEVPRPLLLATLPLVCWCYLCKGAGELLGYLRGPGASARRLI